MKTYFLILHLLAFQTRINNDHTMTTRQQQNYNNQAAKYLQALKKGLQQTSSHQTKYDDDVHYDDDLKLKLQNKGSRRNTSSSSTNSSSKKSTVRRSERIQQQQQQSKQQQQEQQEPTKQPNQEAEEHKQPKQKQLTKRQQVMQRYAREEEQQEASGAASVLASIADAAVTRSQLRNQNRVIWTERDRIFASEAAELALEIASAAAAKASTGRKKKEQPPAHLTRLEQKARSSVRFEKEMGRLHFD